MAAPHLWQLDAVSLGASRLREVTLTLTPGRTALLGWSGAGKTSLLNVLAGFERPDRGTLRGDPRVAWVPQSGGLWHHCTAREHLEIVGASAAEMAALADELELTSLLAARPDQLSQGERSRLAIARALATPADVCLMDEPLAHLDPRRARSCWQAIRTRLEQRGTALLYATHSPETVIADATRAICLHEGRILYDGAVDTLHRTPPSEELMWYLGAGNWLTPADARAWLGAEWSAPAAVRPERLSVEVVEAGGWEVAAARFLGSIAEVELRSPAGSRIFFHRPADSSFTPGQRVRLRLLTP